MRQDIRHDSAHKHVTGTATYIDDMAAPRETLHAYIGLSEIAKGRITALDLSEVLAVSGVKGVLTAKDVVGHNDISPTGKGDDPVFATDITFLGQSIFAVVADTRAIARRAAKKAIVRYDQAVPMWPTPPIW